jgi:hypothetical protein
MTKVRFTLQGLALLAFMFALTSMANAQATRTWVSGVGDDVNPCSRTAPCKTFAGAISKTAANGEINAIDPGGFGTVTITKSITIDGAGTMASILSAGTNGVNVNDSATATPNTIIVTLRNLSINGAGTGIHGVNFTSGKSLNIERCTIFGVTQNGVNVAKSASGNLYISKTSFLTCAVAIKMTTTVGAIGGQISDVTIGEVTSHAIQATTGIFMTVRNVTIARPVGSGVRVDGASGLNCEGVVVQGANIGFETATSASARIRIANSAAYDGNTGLAHTAGTIASAGGNRIDGNALGNGTTNGVVATQ